MDERIYCRHRFPPQAGHALPPLRYADGEGAVHFRALTDWERRQRFGRLRV